MPDYFFTLDKVALGIALALCALIFLCIRYFPTPPRPYLYFSSIANLSSTDTGWRSHYAWLPERLLQFTLLLFLLAFIDPHLMVRRHEPPPAIAQTPTQGIGIYLILDQSGSMTESVWAPDSTGAKHLITKVQLLKSITKAFIDNNKSNLIGLIEFARVPQVISPLTLDHQAILDALSKFNVIQDKAYDGTAMGYAIYKTASLIAATKFVAEDLKKKNRLSYQLKNTVMVLVTDGFQDPNPLDEGNRLRTMGLEDAATYAKDHGIRLYIINVDPMIKKPEVAPQRRLLKRITELTGGQFFIADDEHSLNDIYGEINKLEKSAIPTPSLKPAEDLWLHYKRLSLYPLLIGLAMASLLAAIFLETTLLRRAP